MVFVRADAITLSIDNLFSIKFDSSLLLTNKSNRVFLALARLDEDAFFLSVLLQYSEADNIVSWKINPIVRPLISQIRIRPDYEDVYCMSAKTEIERNSYPIVLTPGKSHHLSENIVLHLLQRSAWPDNDEGAARVRVDPRDWVFDDRYHVLSSWLASPATADTRGGVRNGNRHHSSRRGHGNLSRATSSRGQRRGERITLRETQPVEVSNQVVRTRPHCRTQQQQQHTATINTDQDEVQDIEAIGRESNWLQDLKEGLWDILEITRVALLDSLAPTTID